jgi:hypothetical protein
MRRPSSLRWLSLAAVAALGAACGDNSVVGGPTDAGPADTGTAVDTGAAVDTGIAVDTPAPMDTPMDLGADTGAPVDTGTTDAGPADTGPADVPSARCTQNSDCAGNELGLTVCDTATGRCVQCVTTDDTCMPAQHCDGATNRCVAGCRSDEGCTMGQRCDTAAHACVACVTDTHCPTGQRCMGNQCVAGCTDDSRCAMGERCCGGGCVDVQANTSNCGACGTTCMASNGTAACTMGACAVGACNTGFANCDNDAGNGCESNTTSSVAHCGACGNACPSRPNSEPTCTMGTCGLRCNAGFADCDMDASNGCEVNLGTSAAHCGACGAACQYANAAGVCMGGACQRGACNAGFGDCDMDAANGCEVNLGTSTAHCGACGTMCSAMNGTAGCAMGACTVATCNAGFGNCDGNAANGCETPTGNNPMHCGACGTVCPSGVCRDGMCRPAACDDGVRNGAESDVDCGGACTACTLCRRCNTNSDCGAEVCGPGGRCTVRREVTIDWLVNCRGPGGGNTPTRIEALPAGAYRVTALDSGATVWSSVSLPSQGYFYRISCDNLSVPSLATPAGTYYANAASAFAALPTTTAQVTFGGGALICSLDDNPCSDNRGNIRFQLEHICP